MTDLERAEKGKQDCLQHMRIAFQALREAQGKLASVEGDGSPAYYDEIANLYVEIDTLTTKIDRMTPTGLFQI